MNVLRRNAERRHIRSGTSEKWMTFYPREPAGPLDEGFGAISLLEEIKLPSKKGVVSTLESESELITYVHKGALALEGPMGHSGVIIAGEFQCMIIGRIVNQRVTNTSPTDPVHFFRIHLRVPLSRPGGDCDETQTRFTAAQRRNVLCAVASPDARNASLRMTTDTCIYSSILDPGQHIVHELLQGRKAWLHIIHGKVHTNEFDLSSGDGLGIDDESSISLTVRDTSELILVDTASDIVKIHR